MRLQEVAGEHLAPMTIFTQAGITTKELFCRQTPVHWFPLPAFPHHIQTGLMLIKTNTESKGITRFVEISGETDGG